LNFMKTSNAQVIRIIKECNAQIILDDGRSFLIYGQIINGHVIMETILPAFHMAELFDALDGNIKEEIRNTAYKIFSWI